MNLKNLLFLFSFCSAFLFGQNEFITVWKPNESNILFTTNNSIYFPGIGTNYKITWEEIGYPAHNGVLNNVTSTQNVLINFGNPHNPVAANATYRVKVSNGNGHFHRIKFADSVYDPVAGIYQTSYYGEIFKIQKIEQWGNIQWSSMQKAFILCRDLQLTATDVPNLSQVTDVSYMFFGIQNFTGHTSMQNWNTSNIQDFSYMFAQATNSHPSPLGVFNINISGWNMSNAVNLAGMLRNQGQFNQPIGSWNVSNVTDMSYMFGSCTSFNQNLNNWNTASVTNLSHMFIHATGFNQPLSNWNTSAVTDMSGMFHNASSFNQPIASWNTANVTTTDRMFFQTPFNQPINSWNTSSLTNISHMFLNNTSFNQPLNNWDVSNVTLMRFAFGGATSFNQPLDSWDTSAVTSMSFLFMLASSFNQNLANWDLTSLTEAFNMLNATDLSCQNYNNTLIGWATNPNTHANINLGNLYPLIYSSDAANSARQSLIQNKGWTFNGDVFSYACSRELSVSEASYENAVSVYPNPVSSILFIKTKEKLQSVSIFDASGRLILKTSAADNSVYVNDLAKGNYVIEINTSENSFRKKFIKK